MLLLSLQVILINQDREQSPHIEILEARCFLKLKIFRIFQR